MEENKIKRPIVVITLGAIFGIICGLNLKNSILIFICIILLFHMIISFLLQSAKSRRGRVFTYYFYNISNNFQYIYNNPKQTIRKFL